MAISRCGRVCIIKTSSWVKITVDTCTMRLGINRTNRRDIWKGGESRDALRLRFPAHWGIVLSWFWCWESVCNNKDVILITHMRKTQKLLYWNHLLTLPTLHFGVFWHISWRMWSIWLQGRVRAYMTSGNVMLVSGEWPGMSQCRNTLRVLQKSSGYQKTPDVRNPQIFCFCLE